MMRNIKEKLGLSGMLLTMLLPLGVQATELAGTWVYEKGTDYFSKSGRIDAPKYKVIQIVDKEAAFSSTCFVRLNKDEYGYSMPFQAMLKQGVEERTLDAYLVKNFSFSLMGKPDYYEDDPMEDCNAPLRSLLVSGDMLLIPSAGTSFYAYRRSSGGTGRAVDPKVPLGERKLSQLPFSVQAYMGLCVKHVARIKGGPKATAKCAPTYYPYVADSKNADALAKLIGNHDYKKGGANYAEDYSPPFASQLHPTFVVLPPLKDVLLVRVDDFEGRNEQRDPMTGVFLAIKDGKVTDQLNEGCTIDTAYNCIDSDGKKRYQLLETGKFKKLP